MATNFDGVDLKKENLTNNLMDDLGLAKPGEANIDKKSGTAANSASGLYLSNISGKNIGPEMWKTDGQDWYKIYGYRFSIAYVDIEGGASIDESLGGKSKTDQNAGDLKFMHFTLPIPPQQLITKPILPSKVTPTLGGVVEETSQVKFWLINMAGTTGTSISRLAEDVNKREKMASKFREAIETTGLLAGAFADANALLGKVSNTVGSVVDGLQSGNLQGLAGGVTGALNSALTPGLPYNKSAVDGNSNGFVEAQELQKFFYMYNALKSRYPNKFSLLFTNFKTGQSWRCIINDFQLQQAADNPHLFKYNISVQGWDVKNYQNVFFDQKKSVVDRFGEGGDLEPVNTLTAKQITGVFF